MLRLTPEEEAMASGARGKAAEKAMDLLIRYAQALGAERFVETHNVAGVPGSAPQWLKDKYKDDGGDYRAVFCKFDLDAEEVFDVPVMTGNACHLQGGMDPELWREQGFAADAYANAQRDERETAALNIRNLKTCTPYLAGNTPTFGEHCAWMESSAVVYCNSVLGARTNTEGRESTSAAMITHRIPDWGFHRDEFRLGDHLVEVDVPVDNIFEWGMLGYYVGEIVQEEIPVIDGAIANAGLIELKHFGAAAASSGGVEMYHLVGKTPEAPTRDKAFGGKIIKSRIRYGAQERRQTYENLNLRGKSTDVDYVMLGCPHAAIDQIAEAARLLDGRKLNAKTALWIFTSRHVRAEAQAKGLVDIIRKAGALVMTDTCSAIAQSVPKGTKVVALDSAKQTHYLPAFLGIEAWYGTTEDCINAALTGKWRGSLS
ncbi:MAG: aconitase X catalytic domain-containing protein [Parvularculaceae bacterium]